MTMVAEMLLSVSLVCFLSYLGVSPALSGRSPAVLSGSTVEQGGPGGASHPRKSKLPIPHVNPQTIGLKEHPSYRNNQAPFWSFPVLSRCVPVVIHRDPMVILRDNIGISARSLWSNQSEMQETLWHSNGYLAGDGVRMRCSLLRCSVQALARGRVIRDNSRVLNDNLRLTLGDSMITYRGPDIICFQALSLLE